MLSKGLKIPFTVEEIDRLGDMDSVDQVLSLTSNPRILTSSVLAAWQHMSENPGLDFTSPEIVGMLVPDKSHDSKGNKITLPDKQLSLIGELNGLIAKTPEAFAGLTWPEKIDMAFRRGAAGRRADAQEVL